MNIWPEWSEAEEAKSRGGRGGTGLFEDPDSFELPPGLARACHQWKRPSELLAEEEGCEEPMTPVIVEVETAPILDLIRPNLHILPLSDVVRWIVCQLHALWQYRDVFLVSPTNPSAEPVQWKPWEHIFPQKGSPILSPNGRYTVRLFWLNTWRRITIDDLLPVDVDGRLLLPATSNRCELWPALLSKAILKVASLDYCSPTLRGDFGEASVVHMLTGWCPQRVDTQDARGCDHLWPLFMRALPLWKRPSEAGESKSPVPSPEKPETTTIEPTASRASMKGKSGGNKSAKSDSKKPASRMGGQGKKQAAEVTPDRAELLEKFSKLNPDGEPEHPSTCLLFATYRSSGEAVQPFELKKYADTFAFLKANHIPPDQSHPLQLMEVRDRPLKTPEPPPPYPPKMFPRYPGHRHRRENPFDSRLPPPSPPKDPRFVRLRSELAGTYQRTESQTPDQPLLVSLIERVRESERSKERLVQRVSAEGGAPSDADESEELWVEFDEFLRLFSSLYIFYRPDVYPFDEKIERVTPQAVKGGTRTPTSGTNSRTPLNTNKSQLLSSDPLDSISEHKLVLVDSARPIHILISLSAFVNWKTKLHGSLVFQKRTKVTLRPIRISTSRSTETIQRTQQQQQQQNGLPTVDKTEVLETKEGWVRIVPYDWKQIGECRPLHIIQTSAVNSFLLSLPPGRHAYRLTASSPIGMALCLRSHSRFRLLEEEELLSLLTASPAAFRARSRSLYEQIFELALSKLRNVDEFSKVLETSDLSPVRCFSSQMCQALFDNLLSAKDRVCILHSKYLLCKIFLLDTFRRLDPELQVDTSKSYKPSDTPESWRDRTPTEEEQVKAAKLQFFYRVHRRVHLRRLYQPGRTDNEEFCEDLTEIFSSLKEDLLAAWEDRLYRLCEQFPEQRPLVRLDGSHEMKVYTQTHESSAELLNEKWALLFRDTFQLSRPNFLSFLLFSKGPSKLRLKMIDNDTGQELPSVSGRLLPRQYQPNELGYTLLGEVVDGEGIGEVKWKLMVVGTNETLPTLRSGEQLLSHFSKQREKEPYLPDKNYVMFRYVLTSRLEKDTHATLHLTTSKPEAMFRVRVEQEGQLEKEVEGKGTCLIPSLLIRAPEEGVDKREYILSCEVLRKSWSHQESAWEHYNELKNISTQPDSTGRGTPHDAKKKPEKKTGTVSKSVRGKNVGSKHASSGALLDRYPHWVLRVACPQELELSKDTRRADEIKKMKEGWEEVEEGRAERAKQTRESFIRGQLGQEADEGNVTDLEALHSETSLINPIQPVVTNLELPQTDFSSHETADSQPARLMDRGEEERRESEQRRDNQQYKEWRQGVLVRRENERKLRNHFKARQLATLENLIKISDEFHEKILQPREAMRLSSLKSEKVREEVDSPSQGGKEGKKDKKDKSPPKGKARK